MNRPRVTLKLATSLDGRIATASGESRWITGEAARAEVQRMRAAHEGVLIGAETARRDNPSLLARTEPPPARQPGRFVLTSAFDIPTDGRLFEHLDQSPLTVIGAAAGPTAMRRITEAGAKTLVAADVRAALEQIGAMAQSVLVEGGGRLAASLLQAGLVDRIEWFRAPILLGAEGAPAVAALALARLSDAPTFRRVA